MDLPEITEIQRIRIESGDKVIVKMAVRVTTAVAINLRRYFAAALEIDPGRVIILDPGMDISVIAESQC